MSTRQVARDFNCPLTSLFDHIQAHGTIGPAYEAQMRLCKEEEDYLVQWIIVEDKRNWPPTVQRVRDMATLLLHAHHDYLPLGVNWIQGFKKQNPRVSTMIGRKIDRSRRDGSTYEALNAFYTEFHRVKTEFSISDSNIWNFDETGTAIGSATNGRVMAEATKKRTRCIKDGKRERVHQLSVSLLRVSSSAHLLSSKVPAYRLNGLTPKLFQIGSIRTPKMAGPQTSMESTG